jgi:hypothetical protein
MYSTRTLTTVNILPFFWYPKKRAESLLESQVNIKYDFKKFLSMECFRMYSICFCYIILLKEFTRASAVSQRIPRSHWDRWIRFRGLFDTAKSASAVSFRRSLVLKATFLCKNNVVGNFFKDSADSLKLPKPLPRSHWRPREAPFDVDMQYKILFSMDILWHFSSDWRIANTFREKF